MLELLTSEQMGRADGLTIATGTSGETLMENAGRAVARTALRVLRGRGRICVLAGPGNNGGDGFVAARLLAEHGLRVEVALHGQRDRLSGDAADAAVRYTGPVGSADGIVPGNFDLIIDALFGAGLSRPIGGPVERTISAVNDSGATVVAVDVPSGIDGTTGAIRGCAVRADHTVTFFRAKPGHLLLPGRLHCGDVHVEHIGIGRAVLAEIGVRTWSNHPPLWRHALPAVPATSHKYRRGHVLAVSGGPWNTGAIRLSAMGALRAGAGLVTVAAPSEALSVHASHLTAIMLTACDDAGRLEDILSDRRKNAVVIGPAAGISEATRKKVLAVCAAGVHSVLDADALTVFEDDPRQLFGAIARGGGSVVMTPHEGEFGRLFPDLAGAESKLDRAREAAVRSGATVVLKGADTVAADPDGRASINASAPPWLATAGSGDVLSGMIAGLLAQSMPAFEAASAGVWLHGTSARRAGRGMTAEDLQDHIGGAFSDIKHGGADGRG